MLLSIIIPIHQLNEQLASCLRSIERSVKNTPMELILVLDGEQSNADFFDEFQFSKLNIIELHSNNGPAYARNQGAKMAKGEVFFFVDSDVVLHNDTVTKVMEHFSPGNDVAAVIGSYDDAPADLSIVSKFRNLLHHFTHQTSDNYVNTFWGACGAIRREAFEAVGGFDTYFSKPSVEDVDLGYRLRKHGFFIRLDKQLQIKHLKKWTFSNMVKTDIFYRARPWTLLLFISGRFSDQKLNLQNNERFAAVLVVLIITQLLAVVLFPYVLIGILICLTLLLILKKTFYTFLRKYFLIKQMPLIFFYHCTYLISAFIGFMLGVVDLILGLMRVKNILRPVYKSKAKILV